MVEQSSLKDKLVEVAGRIFGMVVEDNKKTLLIRQVHDGGKEIVLLEKAMYFDRASIVNSYWVKIVNSNKSIKELTVKPLDVRCNFF
ncbi:hypothetical protein [Limosilactobacillus reuteri]|uniref:hypothetical protein n=1 Tax=Limosilactobacillus reuteri TaxID=1598 RepID=UPI001094C611|nr:hypothetical protein [Limosilactobacillus reuteri]TGY56733.1 hypothetical protein E5337_09535 [Limosilactobacillus reuteri]